jgi:flagellin-like hook-associated protein FlgL
MAISVHTNQSALVALQNLNKTNDDMAGVQNRISTGLKVQGAKDNASVWGIAQAQRADLGALSAVKMSLDRAQSIADVAMTAGETVSDLMLQMKEKVTAAMDPSLDTVARTALTTSISNVNQALGDLGAQSRQIEAHNTFVSKLTDVLNTGIGSLVDADLAKESARLQALQVQQQLGAQALSIANQQPQIVLSLFKS